MLNPIRRMVAVGTAAAIALIGFTPLTPATAETAANPTRAANYIVRNLPSATDGAAASITAALGLAAASGTGDCTYAPALRTLVKQIEKQAKSYLYPGRKLSQARAANLAIAVEALGLNPRKFAGRNLVSLVTKSLPGDGRIGGSDSAFSQGLGIIALKRAGATIPVTLLTKLLSLQDDTSGAFGYEWPAGEFNADPDSTGLAILGLQAVGQLDPQVTSALDWARENRTEAGYWDNFSPVDSTGVLGSAVRAGGGDVSASLAWLGGVQNADGGFPNSLEPGTGSDRTATANALWLLKGRSLLDVSMNLGKCPASPPKLPAATSTCTGVWVVVDRGNGEATTRCATTFSTGLAALRSAGFKLGLHSSGYLQRISGFPAALPTNGDFWNYFTATPNPDGTWSDWTFSAQGADQSRPVKGSVEGWLHGPWLDGAKPDLGTPPRGYAASQAPAIDGTAKVGQTLTVVTGVWDPEPEFGYRWYRSGKAITGATNPTYKLTRADAGKLITVKVTASGKGLQTKSLTSPPTAKVAK